jgi:hypothetical protein
VYRSVAVHIFYLVASLGALRISVFFFGESVLLNLDLPLSILLLELFVTHLNEHVVIDLTLVWDVEVWWNQGSELSVKLLSSFKVGGATNGPGEGEQEELLSASFQIL